jgi:MFS family permease
MRGLLLVVFVNYVGVGILIPILPYAVIDVAGGSETAMAVLMASFAIAMFIASPVLGVISDRVGRRKVLLASILIATIGHLIFALTTDLAVMFAARIIAGIGAGNIGVILAIITDVTKPADRAKWMGRIGAFVGLGFVAGPALGGLLSGLGGAVHTAPFLLASGLSLTGLMISVLGVHETAPTEASRRRPMAERWESFKAAGLTSFAVALFLLNLGFAQIEVSFVLVLKDLLDYSSIHTGWVFTWVGILVVTVEGLLIAPVARRLTDLGTTVMGSAVLTAGQILTVFAILTMFAYPPSSVFVVLFTTTVICVGFAFCHPTVSSAASHRTRTGEIGGALGLVQGVGSLGQVAGLLLAGPLYERGGGALTFGLGAAASALLCVVVIWIILESRIAQSQGSLP